MFSVCLWALGLHDLTGTSPLLRDTSTRHREISRLRGGGSFDLKSPRDDLNVEQLDELFERATALKPQFEDDHPSADEGEHPADERTVHSRKGRRSVLPPWSGRSAWLWQQWRGTVLEATWKRMALAMGFSTSIIVFVRYTTAVDMRWPLYAAPAADHPIVKTLKLMHHMWGYLLTITTFVTTFMIGHAYSFWRQSYAHARQIQGRLGDLGLLLSTHAAREPGSVERSGECFAPGVYTPAARDLIALTTRRLALTHVLFWAGVVRQAPGSDRFGVSFNMLLCRQALAHLAQRGAMTVTEHSALLSLIGDGLPRPGLYLAVLAWVTSDLAQGLREGIILGGPGAEFAILETVKALRAVCATVPDDLAARMPLAYVHFVQVLTDVLCLTAPLALYPSGGGFTPMLSGVMMFFFSGVLELCKSLLDPFGTRRVSNYNFRADIQVDVLLAESNGGLVAWPRRLLAIHDTATSSLPMAVPLVVPDNSDASSKSYVASDEGTSSAAAGSSSV